MNERQNHQLAMCVGNEILKRVVSWGNEQALVLKFASVTSAP